MGRAPRRAQRPQTPRVGHMKCSVDDCNNPSRARGLCPRHYEKLKRYGSPYMGRTNRAIGTGHLRKADGYLMVRVNGVERLEHLVVAEKALGHSLPRKARVHHVNENRQDNRPENLVICPDDNYHKLLHQRMRAMKATGHADWRKCQFCQQWSAPSCIVITKLGASFHRDCRNADQNTRNAEKRKSL